MNKLAIFVSGSGTNMENLICRMQEGQMDCQPVVVICDNPKAAAIDKANRLGVEVALLDRAKFASKAEFESAILKKLEEKKIDWIALAGFMRILSGDFVRRYAGRILNIHPSLLPDFPGGQAIKDAFEAKVKETGVTVHFVDEGVDTGPVILQKKVRIEPGETLATVEAKIHAVEYEIYPEAIKQVLSGNVRLPQHHHEDEFWTKD